MREPRQTQHVEGGTVQRVDEERRRRDGEDPADGSPRRFEDDGNGAGTEHEVDCRRSGRAVNEGGEIDEWPAAAGDRANDQQPVERRHGSGGTTHARIEKEREHQRDQQKTDAIDLRLNDEQHPVERIQRQPRGQRRCYCSARTRERACPLVRRLEGNASVVIHRVIVDRSVSSGG